MCTTNLLSGPKNKIVKMIILTFQYVCRMNKQHVFDKFDITYKFYNVKKTFIRAVLQWEIERNFVVLITVTHKSFTCHRYMKITYSNTKYHLYFAKYFFV